jgi:hypothetical protein
MQNQALLIILTLVMNTLNAIVALTVFKPGSVGFIVCAIAGAAISNTLALFGHPVASKDKAVSAGIGLLLPLAFVVVALSGCATAGGKALTACELGKLPSEGQVAFATAQQIATNQNSTAADLEAAAMALLPGQLECGAKALLAWLESLASPNAFAAVHPPVRLALLAASDDVTREHAIAVLHEYLAAHPATACGDAPRVAEALDVCDSTDRPPTDAHACRKLACDSEDVDCARLPLAYHFARRAL